MIEFARGVVVGVGSTLIIVLLIIISALVDKEERNGDSNS